MSFRSKEPTRLCLCGGMSGPTPPDLFDDAINSFLTSFPKSVVLVYGGVSTGLVGRVAEEAGRQGVTLEGALIPMEKPDQSLMLSTVKEFDTYDARQEYLFETASTIFFLPGGLGTFHEFFTFLLKNKLSNQKKEIVVLNWRDYFTPVRTLLQDAVASGFLGEADLSFLLWR